MRECQGCKKIRTIQHWVASIPWRPLLMGGVESTDTQFALYLSVCFVISHF